MSQNISKVKALERKEKLLTLIKEIGLGNINQTAISSEWGVNRKTIERDIKNIVANYNFGDLNGSKIKIFTSIEKSLNDAHKTLRTSTDERVKSACRRDIALLTKEYVDVLEKFGIKPKVADKNEITIKESELELALKDAIKKSQDTP